MTGLDEVALYLQFGKAKPNKEVGGPVGASCHSNSCRARALLKELRYDEPWDGARSHLEARHKSKHRHNSKITEFWSTLLKWDGV